MERFTCDDISAVLSGLLDGELDERTQHLAEVHLAQCEKCRALVNEAEELDAQVRSVVGVGESAWSDEAARRVLFAIDEPGRELRTVRRLRLSAWVGWGTAIAALMTLAFVLNYQNSGLMGGNGDAKLAAKDTTITNEAAQGETDDGAVNQDENMKGLEENRVAMNDGGGNDVVKKSGLDEEIGQGEDNGKLEEGNHHEDGVGEVNNEIDLSTKTAMNTEQEGRDEGMLIDISSDFEGVNGRLVSFVPDFEVADAALTGEVDDVDTGDRVAIGVDENDGLVVNNRIEERGGPMETGVKDDGEVADVELGNGTDDVLYSAAVLLRALQSADDNSFDDVREINQAIEFDDLLDRLAASRKDVWSDDAAVVDQAWAALEWVSGPVDQGQLRQVQTMIANEDLAGRMERMSGEYGTY